MSGKAHSVEEIEGTATRLVFAAAIWYIWSERNALSLRKKKCCSLLFTNKQYHRVVKGRESLLVILFPSPPVLTQRLGKRRRD